MSYSQESVTSHGLQANRDSIQHRQMQRIIEVEHPAQRAASSLAIVEKHQRHRGQRPPLQIANGQAQQKHSGHNALFPEIVEDHRQQHSEKTVIFSFLALTYLLGL